MPRCDWAKTDLSIAYHDAEWGVPSHDDRHLFEMLILEGAQAGLSWEKILKKRARYRRVFDRFDPRKVAKYDAAKIKSLLADPGIVRNRLKIAAAVTNAKAFLAVQKEFGSFDAYIWRFTGGKPIVNRRRALKELQPRTPESDAIPQTRLQVRRLHHLPSLHAGHRHGQRPPHHLPSPRRLPPVTLIAASVAPPIPAAAASAPA